MPMNYYCQDLAALIFIWVSRVVLPFPWLFKLAVRIAQVIFYSLHQRQCCWQFVLLQRQHHVHNIELNISCGMQDIWCTIVLLSLRYIYLFVRYYIFIWEERKAMYLLYCAIFDSCDHSDGVNKFCYSPASSLNLLIKYVENYLFYNWVEYCLSYFISEFRKLLQPS